MNKYRLKKWYPSLYDDIEVGTIVDYEDGWIYWYNKRGNKTTMEIDEWELSHKDFWELIEEEKPFLVTEDGVFIYQDEWEMFAVEKRTFRKISILSSNLMRHLYLLFSEEANADEYIWRNKPLFSYGDIFSYLPTGSDIGVFEQLAKERIEDESKRCKNS